MPQTPTSDILQNASWIMHLAGKSAVFLPQRLLCRFFIPAPEFYEVLRLAAAFLPFSTVANSVVRN